MGYIALGRSTGTPLSQRTSLNPGELTDGTIDGKTIVLGGGSSGVLRSHDFDGSTMGWALYGDGTASLFGTTSITTTGDITTTGTIDAATVLIGNGVVGTPTLAFASDLDTGIYRQGANALGITAGGTRVADFHLNGSTAQARFASGSATIPSITFFADTNTGFYWPSADRIGMVLGGDEAILFRTSSNQSVIELRDIGNGWIQNEEGGHLYISNQEANNQVNIRAYNGASARDRITIIGNGDTQFRDSGNVVRATIESAGQFAAGNYYGALGSTAVAFGSSSGTATVKMMRNTSTAGAGVLTIASNVGGTDSQRCIIYADGDIENINNSYNVLSDRRLKTKSSIKDARSYLEDLRKLQVRNYRLKGEKKVLLGYVADEVEKVIPGLVKKGDPDGEGMEQYDSVRTSVISVMNTQAIQELADKIDALTERLDKLIPEW